MAIRISQGPVADPKVDGLFSGFKWSGTLTYSTSVSAAERVVVDKAMADVMAFTNLDIASGGADINIARSAEAKPTAYATPVLGNYAYFMNLHEVGHALGLKDLARFSRYDSLEYTVMSQGSVNLGYLN